MKKLILMSAMAFALSATIFAQTTTTTAAPPVTTTKDATKMERKAERMEKREAKLKEKLNLTDDQAAQVKSSQQEFRSQAKAIKNDATLTPDQKKEKIKGLAEARNAKMKTVLNDEQFAKLKKARKNHGKMRKEKQDKNNSGDAPK